MVQTKFHIPVISDSLSIVLKW